MRNLRAKCIECACCDPEKLLCHPNDIDCAPEYQLLPEDLTTPKRCDFFKNKEKNGHEI